MTPDLANRWKAASEKDEYSSFSPEDIKDMSASQKSRSLLRRHLFSSKLSRRGCIEVVHLVEGLERGYGQWLLFRLEALEEDDCAAKASMVRIGVARGDRVCQERRRWVA
jgi:hypothetical protein